MILYVNGTNVASRGDTDTGTSQGAYSDVFALDDRRTAGEAPGLAILDEVYVWGRDLTTTEITTLYNSGLSCQYDFTACPSLPVTVVPNFGDLILFGSW